MKRKVMSKSNRIFYIVNTVLLMICLLLVAMPILNVVASSLSSPSAVIRGQVSFWPKGWNIDAYEEIFSNRSLLTGYKNSIIYTIVGTCVNIVLTIMAAGNDGCDRQTPGFPDDGQWIVEFENIDPLPGTSPVSPID